MRTFALVYNLTCGVNGRAYERLNRIRRAFHARGVDLHPYCTSSATTSSAVVQAAVASGCEAILSAGGDGTFNSLLQATIENGVNLPIGILPFGSGNVLAQELGLKGDPSLVAEKLITARATKMPVGVLTTRIADGTTFRRYFNVAAGIGADARVICGVNPAWKRRFGITAYYVEATRQLLSLSNPLPLFRVRFTDSSSGENRDEHVSQVIAERVGYFSSPLRRRNGTDPLLCDRLRLILFKTQQRSAYIRYGLHLLARGLQLPAIPGIEVSHAKAASCELLPGYPDVLTEVDGEFAGELPAEVTIIPDALAMLLPRRPGTTVHNTV